MARSVIVLNEGEVEMVVAEFGTGEALWTMLWFFLWVIWIWMLITVFADIFRSHDLSGWGKALWSIFVLVAPFLGVFVYLIARGSKMSEHAVEDAQARESMFRQSVQQAVGGGTTDIDQLEKLASLKAQGVIDEDEFTRLKAQYTGV
jgi:hypothetical protein